MRSEVWSHLTKIQRGKKVKCNYCEKSYACDSNKTSTSGLWKHFKNCQANKSIKIDERQKVLARQLNDNDGGDGGIANITVLVFNKEACRRAMGKMIIVDELPFSFIEGVGFRKFMRYACPKFDIPSCRTVAMDILKLYSDEKEILKGKLISNKHRVCLTTDCWTSIQNISYMVIMAHFIDKNWVMYKKILNFSMVPNHKGETIRKLIETCLLDWGIEHVSTITIDNASANDGAIVYIKKVLKNWKVDGMVLGGSFMHVRCFAHIVNLIVNDGLKEFNVAIASIRNAVKYFRSSPSRLAKFKICIEREKIECKKLAILDVPTRWNATYLMLNSALKFEKAFDRMAEEDGFYCKYFVERENGKEREGPPTTEDWEKGRKFVKFLKTFYETTLKFSASSSVTSNLYFQHLLKIFSDRQDPILSDMAKNMKTKFDKYWGSVEKMNKILIVATVLDPRHKLEFVGCIGRLYDNILVESTKDEIKNLLYELYNQYKG
ncbi:zinc finger BED domain-containing protein RICESLEEPER 1-like [Olea europaea var. sylvestris]|uniref:zinc finger BED domain-containing protein RICESLEEPER 1-like n=1 Tax=Olea europaea var. sylvestris TaxID=158386 RepID=UPI000C1CEBF4|nr:zinc finger BED domain-containing protein RICESLEEPER 1-like [Olea europaea var. sylvestris]